MPAPEPESRANAWSPRLASRRARAAVGLFAAVALLLALAASAQATYEGLANPGLEGPAVLSNGFLLAYDNAKQVDNWCPTGPATPPVDGEVRNGACAVDLAQPGPTTDYFAVGLLRVYPEAWGNRVSALQSITGYHYVPHAVPPQEQAKYQFFYRIDTTDDSVADACIVQAEGFTVLPAADMADWQPITFSSEDPSIKFQVRDADCTVCVPDCTAITQGEVKVRFPTGRILVLYIQLYHADLTPATAGCEPWPSGHPVYLDDLSVTMDDHANVLFGGAYHLEVTESTPAVPDPYTVRLGAAPAAGETVTVSVTEDPGSGGSNQLVLSPATLTFTAADWNMPQTVPVKAVDDYVSEADPKVTTLRHTVTSSSPLSPYNGMATPSFPVIVHDNDLVGANPVPATIQLSEAAPATTATFNVQLGAAPAPGETVTVTLTPDARTTLDTDPDTAGDQDTLTFTTTDPMSKPVVVTVVDDTVDQPNLAPAAIIAGDVVSNVPASVYNGWPFPDVEVEISDNDPLVSIAAGVSGNEAGPVAGTFVLTRGPDTANDVEVAYSLDASGTAASGVDFTALAGTITIPAGSASVTLGVPVLDDTADEATETVVLTLTATSVPYTTASGAAASASIDILDNDDPTVTVQATTPAASEAGPVAGVLTITRSNADLAVDVAYTLGGTAAAGDRSVDLASPVHFDAGQSSRTLTVTPVDDAADEPPETVVLTLDAGTGYQLGSTASDTVTIADDDLPEVSVSVTTHAAEEGLVSGVFTLTRTAGDTSAALVVAILVDGTAQAGTDYTVPSAGLSSVTIAAGATSATVTIAPIQESLVEAVETVVLHIQANASAYTIAPAPGHEASMDLKDNDYEVSITASVASATEGGTAQFTLTRDKDGPAFAVQLQYTGSATGGTDYTALPATVSFAPGQLTATLDVATLADATDEPSETVTTTLVVALPYTISGPASANVTINDADPPMATADSVTAYLQCAASFAAPGLLANDDVPTGLSYSAVAQTSATAQGGSVSVASDGSFTYTPPAGFTGSDSFQYRVTDGVLQSAPATVQVTVVLNAPPSLTVSATPAQALVGEAVSFTGLGIDFEGPISSWTWSFGDGDGATQPSVTHAYGQPGRYVVTLQVADGQCATRTAKVDVEVGAAVQGTQGTPEAPAPLEVPPPPQAPGLPPPEEAPLPPAPPAPGPANRPPRAVVTGPLSVLAGQSMRLDASSSTDADGDPLHFTWTQLAGRGAEVEDDGSGVANAAAPESAGAVSYLVVVSDGKASDTAVVEVFVRLPAEADAPPPPPPAPIWGDDGAARGPTGVSATGDAGDGFALLVAWVAVVACLSAFVLVAWRIRTRKAGSEETVSPIATRL